MTSRITYVHRPASSPRLYGCLAFRCYCHCWNCCCNTSVPKQPRSLRLTDDITVSMPRSSLTANARKHCKNIQLTSVCTHITFIMLPCVKQVIYSTPLSRPPPFTPDLKLISFTNPFLHSHSYCFRTDFTDLNLYWIKGALAFVCFSFFFMYFCIFSCYVC